MISPRIYVIVPRTLLVAQSDLKTFKNVTMTCGRMAAQVAHITGQLALNGVDVPGTDLIILQTANSVGLVLLKQELDQSSVDYIQYHDTNKAHEGREMLTALALYPIERGSCSTLRALKPWVCACNI